MSRRAKATLVMLNLWMAGQVSAAVVVQRWGLADRSAHPKAPHIQHPGTLLYELLPGEAGILMRFDLSAIPKGARVYRARLFFVRSGALAGGFDVVEARRDAGGRVRGVGASLRLVGPGYRWFDATAATARAVAGSGRRLLLLVRRAPAFEKAGTYLEVAYEGRLRERIRQVTGVKARAGRGVVFITFREIEDLACGKEDLSWPEFLKRVAGYTHRGPVPDDRAEELRYRLYRYHRPITACNIGRAELVGEVGPGSGYNTALVPPKGRWKKDNPPVLRLAIEPGKPLRPGVGLFVHHVCRAGRAYYAVVTARNGVENTLDVGRSNTVGPVRELPGAPVPVLQRELVVDLAGTKYVRQWYSLWAAPPLAPVPGRYDLTVEFCPGLLDSRPALTVVRREAWRRGPFPTRPGKFKGIRLSHSEDVPNSFWMGLNDAHGTLKGLQQGRWQPFVQRRQEYLICWARSKWHVDERRVAAAIGSWGMMEIERPGVYAYLFGWGQPEVTRGPLCWRTALAAWGRPEVYAGRADEDNPYRRQDYSRYVLEHPQRELPYLAIMAERGVDLVEMGWSAFPRFFRAMLRTRRAFVASWDQEGPWTWRATPVHRAILSGQIDIHRDLSLPAFSNCTLDDNPGSGELGTGDPAGQINGYLLWDTKSMVETAGRWEVTVWLDESAPRPSCRVDLTPRRCRQFRPRPAQRFAWTNTTLEGRGKAVIQAGRAVADRYGLVTLKALVVGKGRHRIVIEQAKR